MKALLGSNGTLAFMFPNEVFFTNLNSKDPLSLLERELENNEVQAPFLSEKKRGKYEVFVKYLHALSLNPFFGNARDIKFLAKEMKAALFTKFFNTNREQIFCEMTDIAPTLPPLSVELATECVKRAIKQRRRCTTSKSLTLIPRSPGREKRQKL